MTCMPPRDGADMYNTPRRRTPYRCPLHFLALLATLVAFGSAHAQLPQRPGGTPRNQDVDKPAGPAEAAPQAEAEPELPPLPQWPGKTAKKLQFFQLSGYFRFRGDMMHNLNLGQPDLPGLRAPYYTPLSENAAAQLSCAKRRTKNVPGSNIDREIDAGDCPANTLSGANIRLRLEPTINVAEQVRVFTQFDVLDNLALGSTPNGSYTTSNGLPAQSSGTPLPVLSDGQAAPVAGYNSPKAALLVKRAWAEVTTPLGTVKFGRMPWHFGMGMVANNGQCWDCNQGDNVDRVFGSTVLANHLIGFGYDFASSGPSNLSLNSGKAMFDGSVIDLEQLDDVDQLIWVIGRIDRPDVLKDRVAQGEFVVNYGLQLLYRKQAFDFAANKVTSNTEAGYAPALVERHAWMWMPDIWLKILYKKFEFEFEGVLIGGKIENIGDDDATVEPLSLLQFGFAARTQYKFLKDTLRVGLEVGMASGDSAESPDADYNRRRTQPLRDTRSNDDSFNEFRFDNDYHVDLILFRELVGTVSNAIYIKPWIQYDLLESLGGRLDIIYSLAHKPVAFPGNDPNLGLEFDLHIYYKNVEEGFYAGLQYGVLIPFAGLDRPESIDGETLYGSDAKDAEVAHTLQANLIVKF